MKNLITEYPSWAIALCPLLGLGFALLLYYKDKRLSDLSKAVRVLLGFLRFALVTIIAFLLLGPLVRYFQTEIEPPAIVLALDNSGSMVLNKDSLVVRSQIEQLTANVQSQLGGDYTVSAYTFGQNVNEGLDTSFADPVTNISDLFESIKSRFANRNLGAVIVATDGIYNRGSNPRYAVSGVNAPVYTLAMGDTIRRKDALIAEVAANRIAFLGNKFPVEARFRADKLKGVKIDYALLQGNNTVESGSFTPESEQDEKTVRFVLSAQKPGLQRYTIRINPVPDELTLANNQRSVFIDVIDGREKVLILGNAPHPDIAALRNAISSNENYEVDVAYISDFQKKLNDYNVLVLHGLPSGDGDVKLLEEMRNSKIPVLIVVSSQTNIGSLTNFGVRMSSSKNTLNDVGASVNSGFGQFRINENLNSFLLDAPPLRTPFGEWKMSNASETVLYQKIGNIPTKDPLMVVTKVGEQKSAMLLGDGIWRWRLYDFAINENHDLFDGFFGSIVQYLSVKDDKRLFRVQSPANVMENESVVLTAELYNAAYEPINEPEVNIVFTDESGKSYPFVFSRTDVGYRLDAGVLPIGTYAYTASVDQNSERLTDSGSLIIRPFALEAAELTANHNLLNAISEGTGGKMFYPNEVDELVKEIKAAKSMQPVSYTTEILSSFLNFKWPFFLILALLSIEWFIRKRSGHY